MANFIAMILLITACTQRLKKLESLAIPRQKI
jgi:hypothetical protein